MGRKAIVTREKIIDAARTLFSRFGSVKTTIDDIAHSLNVGKSSLYYHFKDKEEILESLVHEDIEKAKEDLAVELEKALTPQQKFKTYIIFRMAFFKKYSSLFTFLKEEYFDQYALIQKIRKNYDSYEQQLISDIMTSGVQRAEFTVKDIPLTSRAVFLSIKSLEYDCAFTNDLQTMEKNISTLFELLMNGVLKRET